MYLQCSCPSDVHFLFSQNPEYAVSGPLGQEGGCLGKHLEKLIAEGEEREIAKGEARGEKRGIGKGEAKSLSRLLERRFGPLPAALKARNGRAKLTQLDAWIDRELDAKSMDAVFRVVE